MATSQEDEVQNGGFHQPKISLENVSSDLSMSTNEKVEVPTCEDTSFTDEELRRMKLLNRPNSGGVLSDVVGRSDVSIVDSASNMEDRISHPSDADSEESHESSLLSDVASAENGDQGLCTHCGHHGLTPHEPLYNGYVFGRNRPSSVQLNSETVTVLHYPFEATVIPPGENKAEYQAVLADSKVYLIGTAHFSPESQQDVLNTIRETQPDIVMVELCPARISMLSMDEESLLRDAKSLDFERIMSIIKQCGAVQGILHVVLLSMSAHITRQLGMAPGGEFRAAYKGSMHVPGCRFKLGDRPIQVTMQRALGSLNFFQKLRLIYHMLMSHRTPITQEEVESCKNSDMLEELMKELAGEFPLFSKIIVEERDQYMTKVLHTLLVRSTYEKRVKWRKTSQEWQPVSVVAVVGFGHVSGIVSNWKRTIEIDELLTIPEPSRAAKVLRWTVRFALVGIVGYGAYRLGSAVFNRIKPSSK
ncbi:hypothetical protein AB6A40_000837 [Gnathostoma spinigerum]|uniref:TraB domain-containing protein n=1 Tax=Gnathostoma spinigerum TaxID=75299 RepID=A0ABD6EBH2_9BILA